MAWQPDNPDELVRLYAAGDGCLKLSRRYGVAPATVIVALRALGVTIRSQKGDAPKERQLGDGRFLMSNGYVRLRREGTDGSRLEHRVLMERLLGRPLHRGESIHHRNGIRHDNRLSNLELRVSTHPSGSSIEEVVAWAREVLATYEPLLEQSGYEAIEHERLSDVQP